MKNILIIWLWEIWTAIKKVEKESWNNVYCLDINIKDKISINEFDIIHVCIPYDEMFIDSIKDYLYNFKYRLVIINSTVWVWTCDILSEYYNWIVHSPVRWVHPNLYEWIKTFVKYVWWSIVDCDNAISHFKSIWINAKYLWNRESTELSKILSTTYYWWNILFSKYCDNMCNKYWLDYNMVYKEWNETYNKWYKKLWKDNVVRPVLKSPYEFDDNWKIWWHCVTSNVELLPDDIFKSFFKKFNKNNVKT